MVQAMGSLDPNGLNPEFSSTVLEASTMGTNNNVGRDKFCIVRNGECSETMELYTSKDMNDKMTNEVNELKRKDTHNNNEGLEKEIDQFLELNELMAGMDLKENNDSDDDEEEDEEEVGDMDEE